MKYPSWLGPIPQGSHGSGSIQKKYWKVTSDYVRIRDFYEWNGKCISCNRQAISWEELQGGHCKSWGACRGYSKWYLENIFGQCPYCNNLSDAVVGWNFKEEVRRRHGNERITYIDSLASHPTEKLEEWKIIELIKERILAMADLPEQPEYYNRVISRINL